MQEKGSIPVWAFVAAGGLAALLPLLILGRGGLWPPATPAQPAGVDLALMLDYARAWQTTGNPFAGLNPYPPLAAVAFAPLAGLPFAVAYGLLTALTLAAFDPDAGVYDYSPYPDDYEESHAAKASQDSNTNPNTNLAAQIFLPLEWSVGAPHLGRILSSAGYTAIYESYGGRGQNVVTVSDQAGRAGVAVMNHRIAEQTNMAAMTVR